MKHTCLNRECRHVMDWYSRADDASELSEEYDLKYLEDGGVDECWYWYCSGYYEGSGQCLYRIGDKYGVWNMGHCSCYGPTEHFKAGGEVPLCNIEQTMTESMIRDAAPLIEYVRMHR